MTIPPEKGQTAGAPDRSFSDPRPVELQPLDLSEILTNEEAAAYLKMSKFTLNRYRVIGGGPRYAKLARGQGGGWVRYRRADLDEWVAGLLVSSTSQTAA